VPDSVPLSLRLGTLQLSGGYGLASSETLGAVTLSGGEVTVNVATGGNGTAALGLGSLTRSVGGTVNFTAANAATALGQSGPGSSRVTVDGISTSNGIIGGWATVNGTDFAAYVAGSGTTQGVGALGNGGFGSYSTVALNGIIDSTLNLNITAAASTLTASGAVNSLRFSPTAAATVAISAGQTLTINSGGLLMGSNFALGISGGAITSGGEELFAYINQNSTTVWDGDDDGFRWADRDGCNGEH